MITRTYVVLLPAGSEAGNVIDILVQSEPGTQDDPVLPSGVDTGGAYYEWRGRPIRFEKLAAAGAAGGFVPRARLGLKIGLVPINSSPAASVPGVQLSASLASLASTDGGPTINIPAFADPSGEPAIRLTGGAGITSTYWLLSVEISEAKDEDRTPQGT